jgi:N-acyl-D-aspartate/D-glutamate deacylase
MFDILIKGAKVVDGTGELAWYGDVAIKNGRFVSIDPRIEGVAKHEIMANGLTLAPGFIDLHTHSDVILLTEPQTDIKLRQGVTLDVIGNCGVSLAPLNQRSSEAVIEYTRGLTFPDAPPADWLTFDEFGNRLERPGLAMDTASMIGHGSLRAAVIGLHDTAPTSAQMSEMKNMLAQAMDEGALGFSTGLVLIPGCYADTNELIELSSVVAEKDGIHVSHVRNEAQYVLSAVDELIQISRNSKVPVHVSHMKVSGMKNWPLADRLVEMLESARAEGVDITCDVYPYQALCMSMLALLPPWVREGGIPEIIPRLKDPVERDRIISQLKEGLPGWENIYENSGWDKITVAMVQSAEQKSMEGKTVAQLADEKSQDPFKFALDLLATENGAVRMFAETMSEENLIRFLSLPFTMIGSDGNPTGSKPHPRVYGTFPRVLRRYVRELGSLTLEEAIKKMTWLPAQRLGLRDLGAIKTGFRANAVLFDSETFADRATYENPRQFPQGLAAVIVNGEMVIDGSDYTGARPGEFIRKKRAQQKR